MQSGSNISVNEKAVSSTADVVPLDSFPVEPSKSVDAKPQFSEDDEVTYPEGGWRAWTVALGAFLNALSTFGYVASWGVFQAFYETGPLAGVSPSKIAWIGSIQLSLMFLPGLITGRLFDLGYLHHIMISAAVISIIANFTIPQCTKFWQFLLCQGIAFGLASGFVFIPAISTVAHWFKVKRPLVLGILALGSSLGGVIFPLMFRSLQPRIGFKWTVRIFAFINSFDFIFINLVMKTRLPPAREKRLLALKDFFSLPYVLYVLSTFFAFFGLFTPFTFLSVSAQAIGVSVSLSFGLLSAANAVSGIGRLVTGALALRFGPLNVMIVFTTIAAAMLFTWPFMTSHAGFIVVICLYGFSSGAYAGLFPAPVAALGSITSVGERTGLQMTVMALGALGGPPISGLILSRENSFHGVGGFAGAMLVVSIVLLFIVRWLVLGRVVGGKL